MKSIRAILRGDRKDRLLGERSRDPYGPKAKIRAPAVCDRCKAVFNRGRWQWSDSWPESARRTRCQACRRIQDNCPAGVLTLAGPYVETHKWSLLSLLRNRAEKERSEHPMHRIMSIIEKPNILVVNTTDLHLPQHMGKALRHACKGELSISYQKAGHFVRVDWNRQN